MLYSKFFAQMGTLMANFMYSFTDSRYLMPVIAPKQTFYGNDQ